MQIPTWRPEPEPVLIKITIIGRDEWSGQLLAEFKIDGQTYAVSVDAELINKSQDKMTALIIADVGAKHLVDLPGESLSAGSRILVGAEELELVTGRSG